MRAQTNSRDNSWIDRTLSVLRTSRLEACSKELTGLGGAGLFDPETTDLDAERLFEESWFAEEEKEKRLHTLEELQLRVLSQFPAEIGLLSPEEHDLILKLIFFGGEMPLMSWDDVLPARTLVKRLWCRMVPEKGQWIRMPRQILVSAVLLLSSEEVKSVRETAANVMETVENTLYLAGMMPAEMAVRDMAASLRDSLSSDKHDLYMRLLEASFETILTVDGRRMLVHPGLADPWRLTSREHHIELDQGSLSDLYASLTEMEDPLYDRMMSLIGNLSRPEISPEETVEDLILLAKQGAPVTEMGQVLGGRIICLPTDEMITVLREMHDRIPRWMGLSMEQLQ